MMGGLPASPSSASRACIAAAKETVPDSESGFRTFQTS